MKLISERNAFKEASMVLITQLKDNQSKVEFSKKNFDNVEKALCEVACERLKYSDESVRVESALADEQCKASQLDRDLQVSKQPIT